MENNLTYEKTVKNKTRRAHEDKPQRREKEKRWTRRTDKREPLQ